MADEQDLQRLCLEYLAMRQVKAWRNNVGFKGHVRYGLGIGSSDIIGILEPSGRMFACELKARGEKPKPEQLAFIHEINSRGGRAFWVDNFAAFEHEVDAMLADCSARRKVHA